MSLLKPYKHRTIYISQIYNKLIVQGEEDGKIDSSYIQLSVSATDEGKKQNKAI